MSAKGNVSSATYREDTKFTATVQNPGPTVIFVTHVLSWNLRRDLTTKIKSFTKSGNFGVVESYLEGRLIQKAFRAVKVLARTQIIERILDCS